MKRPGHHFADKGPYSQTYGFDIKHLHMWELDHKGGCCSFPQSCPVLCDPMDCSTPVFPVLHHLLELAQTRVRWVGDPIQSSHPLSSPSVDWSNLACMHALEKEMAAHSSILLWRIPWTEEPGGLQSIGSWRVRDNWRNLACTSNKEKQYKEASKKGLIKCPSSRVLESFRDGQVLIHRKKKKKANYSQAP